MEKTELQAILKEHKLWLSNNGGTRADLRRADLHGADLRGADLRGADLRGADLRRADLRGADLRRADLHGADLRGANLRRADLRGADLRRADLHGADLRGANLDFASWPLWCGSIGAKTDDRLNAQLSYHAICNMTASQRKKAGISRKAIAFANTFHQVGEVKKLVY